MGFRENLRMYRERQGITAKAFAAKVGLKYGTYFSYEKAGNEPKLETLCKIADVLQVSIDELLGRNHVELKRCPFCGGKPYLEEVEPHTHSDWLKEAIPDLPDCQGEAFIECTGCSAVIAGRTKAEVIELWNRRAKDDSGRTD